MVLGEALQRCAACDSYCSIIKIFSSSFKIREIRGVGKRVNLGWIYEYDKIKILLVGEWVSG